MCLLFGFTCLSEPHRNIHISCPRCSVGSHSNSCTSARPWVCRRCLCTAVRCTGRLAPSAAWPGTLIAPGTVPSARDTFPPPRGTTTHTTNNMFNLHLSSEELLAKLPFSAASSFSIVVTHLGVIAAPALWRLRLAVKSLLQGLSIFGVVFLKTPSGPLIQKMITDAEDLDVIRCRDNTAAVKYTSTWTEFQEVRSSS